MFQEYFARSEHLIWPLLGLLICAAVFCGVLAYVVLGLRDARKLDRLASLPLEPEPAGEDTFRKGPSR